MIIYDVSYFSLNPSAFSPQKKHQTLGFHTRPTVGVTSIPAPPVEPPPPPPPEPSDGSEGSESHGTQAPGR